MECWDMKEIILQGSTLALNSDVFISLLHCKGNEKI